MNGLSTVDLLIGGEHWLTVYATPETASKFAQSWVSDAPMRSAVLYLKASTRDRELRVTIERIQEVDVGS